MDQRGLDVQLLSPPPWIVNGDLASVERVNDAIAADADARRDRFIGMATIPMQEPEEAARELERCVKELGLHGVELLTNVHGENLHQARFAPVYRKMVELDVAAFVHPQNVLGRDRLSEFFMVNIVGNPTDTAVAAGCLVFGGVLAEMPSLRFVLAHGGGTCPLLRGRWEHAWEEGLIEDAVITRPPSEYIRLLYFDSLTHSVPALNHLVETMGSDRVMLGSDYPFGMGDYTPPVSVAALPHLSDAQREAIHGENAIRVFGLEGRLQRV